MHIADVTSPGLVRKDALPNQRLWNVAKGLGLHSCLNTVFLPLWDPFHFTVLKHIEALI